MSKFDGTLPAEPEALHADLIARLRARADYHDKLMETWTECPGAEGNAFLAAFEQLVVRGNLAYYGPADADLDREAADALSRPVTEEMVERAARVLADAIGEPVYTAETADVVRHILTAAIRGGSHD